MFWNRRMYLSGLVSVLSIFVFSSLDVTQGNANNNFTVRLMNGSRASQGRLEVFYNGTWGTVCDDSFDDSAAAVVCRMLGFAGKTPVAQGRATFGSGTGPIWLDEVTCDGTENSLLNCSTNDWGDNDCEHSEDTGVDCEPSTDPVRLVGGSSEREGRVEIYHNGTWGTICDDSWDVNEAQVVCNQLNLSSAAAIPVNGPTFAGDTVSPIWLSEVKCDGDELALSMCSHKPWQENICGHNQDAGVICVPPDYSPSPLKVRLAGSSNPNEGRVEVKYYGRWGTICDDSWSSADAAVVCRMLGLPFSGAVGFGQAAFARGNGQIFMDNVNCTGKETSLDECQFNGWDVNDCGHYEDASVLCQTEKELNIPVRLVGGSGVHEGRVEVYHNGTWGTVCKNHWDEAAATVVCRLLNMTDRLAIPMLGSVFGKPSTAVIWLDEMICSGNETALGACRHKPWGITSCQHAEGAGVVCIPRSSATSQVQVKLVDGLVPYQGLVEINIYSYWGTICDDGVGDEEASVICRMLGYDRGGHVFSSMGVGIDDAKRGPIWLDGLDCQGNETSILDCDHGLTGETEYCGHREDVAVSCVVDTNFSIPIRLVNGSSQREGRVEVNWNGTWRTVCDHNWGVEEAAVACSQLGYQNVLAVPIDGAYFGAGAGNSRVLLEEITCNGTETNIGLCEIGLLGVNGCDHGEDAGLLCLDKSINGSTSPKVRIVDGSTPKRGRVEIHAYSHWGTVCDDAWDDKDASVVCRQLGYPGGRAYSFVRYGKGPVWMDEVACVGTETSITDCQFDGWSQHDCTHQEDAGVICGDSDGAIIG